MASELILSNTSETVDILANLEKELKNPFRWEWTENEVEIQVGAV